MQILYYIFVHTFVYVSRVYKCKLLKSASSAQLYVLSTASNARDLKKFFKIMHSGVMYNMVTIVNTVLHIRKLLREWIFLFIYLKIFWLRRGM